MPLEHSRTGFLTTLLNVLGILSIFFSASSKFVDNRLDPTEHFCRQKNFCLWNMIFSLPHPSCSSKHGPMLFMVDMMSYEIWNIQITFILQMLHWLPNCYWTQFKMLAITCKGLCGLSPAPPFAELHLSLCSATTTSALLHFFLVIADF